MSKRRPKVTEQGRPKLPDTDALARSLVRRGLATWAILDHGWSTPPTWRGKQ